MTKSFYNNFNDHLKSRFGFKVYKVPVSIGASCPNRDGEGKGCTYCDDVASASPIIDDELPLQEQINKGIKWASRKYKAKGFIVYFQPFTNTYIPLSHLEESLKIAVQTDKVVGIAIGTRPDCVPEETLNLLSPFADNIYFWVEYGLQSVHLQTLKSIKRGHTFADFLDAVLRTKKKNNMLICAHIIIGLPGEKREHIIETARTVAALPIDGIKIHLLHLLKNTELARDYKNGDFEVLSMDNYASLVVDVIERLPKNILIQRITGEAEKERLVAPMWCLEKQKVIKRIDEEFKKRNTKQGSKFKYGLSNSQIERRTLESISSKLGRNK